MRARRCVPLLLLAAVGSLYACEDSSAPTAFNPPPTTSPDRDASTGRDAAMPPTDASVLDAPVDAPPAVAPSGVLDLTFNAKGFITRIGSNGGTNDQADDLALDSMGRILVAGSSTGADVKAAVWRFTTAGAVDSTFGTGGVWLKNGSFVSATYEAAGAIAIDPQDRPVVTGQSNNNSPYYMATWRLTTAGVLDTTLAGTGFYGTTGTVGGGGDYDYGAGITVDGAGNILVAGFSTVSPANIDLCVWRHSTTGVLDTAAFAAPKGYFSEHGASNPTANPFDTANRIVLDGTGRIVLSATSFTGTVTQGLVVRVTAAGAIDTTFNTTGLRLISGVGGVVGATAYDGTNGLALDATGRILVGGSTIDAAGHYRAFVTRLTQAGAIDTTFGTSGFTILPSPKNANVTFGGRLAIDSKGRVVVVGSGDGNLAAWRLTTSGALDATFGTAGVFVTTATASATLGDGGTPVVDNATSVRIDSLDRAVISGTSGNATNGFAMAVWRLTP